MRTNLLLLGLGVLALLVGAYFDPAAALVAAGGGSVAFGLLRDDGTPAP